MMKNMPGIISRSANFAQAAGTVVEQNESDKTLVFGDNMKTTLVISGWLR